LQGLFPPGDAAVEQQTEKECQRPAGRARPTRNVGLRQSRMDCHPQIPTNMKNNKEDEQRCHQGVDLNR
jgi:hypothetical protein